MSEEYKNAGVDLNRLKEYHKMIGNMIAGTYKNVIVGAGHYSSVITIGGLKLALHADGVGTKTELAMRTGIIEPTGIDCVAMNVNDLISIGAKPIAILDYITLEKPMDEILTSIIQGLIKGVRESEAELIGGETAIMPGVIKGYDLACFSMGVIEGKIITGDNVRPGDVIIGLESNGIHSNGYSLVRKLIDEGKIKLEEWAEELMKPTRIYVKPILEVKDNLKAIAHITGSAFMKLHRITKYKLSIELPEPQVIFRVIEDAGVSHESMHKVFNMGIGMIVISSKENAENVYKSLSKYLKVYYLGKVEEGSGIYIKTYKKIMLKL